MTAARKLEQTMKRETTLKRTSDRELVIERMFQAPPRIVFTAYTRADLVKQWWAPRSCGAVMADVQADVRVGGKYRYVTRMPDGDFAFSGEYTLVQPHSRLEYTQIFEPMAHAGAAHVTITFEEVDGYTRLVAHELYPSKEALEGAIASGMEGGMREVFTQLDELVATVQL